MQATWKAIPFLLDSLHTQTKNHQRMESIASFLALHYTIIDTVGELMGAELGSLLRRKSSEVRRSRLLRFSSCYKVIYTNKIASSSNKRML